jgi:hypothetical protein
MINYRLILSFILFLTLLSCQETTVDNNKELKITSEQGQEIKMPFLLDTLNFKTTIKTKEKFGTAGYFPLYFGQLKDTIVPNYRIRPYPPPPPPLTIVGDSVIKPTDKYEQYPKPDHEIYEDYFPVYASDDCVRWDSTTIEVKVDTNQTICNIDFRTFQDSTFAFKAYPVFLSNQTNKTIVIGYGTHIALIMEAKDDQGKWRPMERNYTYFCGTGLPDIVLPSKESVVTSATIYKGDFETDIRLKIGDNYSQVFRGKINLTQLEKNKKRHANNG